MSYVNNKTAVACWLMERSFVEGLGMLVLYDPADLGKYSALVGWLVGWLV